MIGRTNTGGGGGGLNFKVVGGTTEPSNPKENTIWVNTDTEITGWVFSTSEPQNPEEGMVWIATGTASTVSFNALKKNGVMVYPLAAKQYISGTWTSKTAKSYQGGAWVEWLTKLYSYGETFSDVTGGWKGVKDSGGAFAINSDHLYIGYSGGTKRDAAMYTVNKIDTTGYSKLMVDVDITATLSGYGFSIGLYTSNTSYSNSFTAKTKLDTKGRVTMSLDLSSYQGSYYIKLQADVSKANVYEVWFER